MKNKKILVLSATAAVILVLGIFTGYIVSAIEKKQTEINKKLPALNACYEPIVDCIENGFNTKTAQENKAVFKKALENGVSTDLYKASIFYNQELIFSGQYLDYKSADADAYCCRDMVCAMFLTCVLATEPENLAKEINVLLDGVFIIDALPQFVYLAADYYPLTFEELNIVAQAFEQLADSRDNPEDKFYTTAFIANLYEMYIANNPEDEEAAQEYLKPVVSQSVKYLKQMTINSDEIWVGYGKYRKLSGVSVYERD